MMIAGGMCGEASGWRLMWWVVCGMEACVVE